MSIQEWEPPQIHKITNDRDLEELIKDENIIGVRDPIHEIAEDMFAMENPDKVDDPVARKQYIDNVLSQGAEYGNWVVYPHKLTVVRFSEKDDHYLLRTFRNRNLITKEEQQHLRRQKLAVFGLSVGSKTVEETVQTGIGDNYMLFDHDRLSVMNLNRLRAGMDSVGLLKTTVSGRKIAGLDPYIEQQHFPGGYDDTTNDILRRCPPDVIVEEVDDLKVKAQIREIANELGVPVIMAGDVDDKSTIDLERYDIGDATPFNGKLSGEQVEKLLIGDLEDEAVVGMLVKILGLKNISPRLLQSTMLRGIELTGFPQLGTTATLGGANSAIAIRDILLGRNNKSRSEVYDPRKLLKSTPPTTTGESLKIVRDFMIYSRGQKKGKSK
mgnify:CR=1 FL=1